MTERLIALLIPVQGEPLMICPHFEEGSLTDAMTISADIAGWQEHEDPYALAVTILADWQAEAVALAPDLPFGMADRLARAGDDIAWLNGTGLIDACRMIKSPAEIALLQYAKNITLAAHALIPQILEPGMTTAQVRGFADEAHKKLGAAGGTSFSIALFGEASSFPHGVSHEQRLRAGQMVLIDMGCRIGGYHADITRSYVFGPPSDDQRRHWDLAKQAQLAAFDAAHPGAPCQALDAAARAVYEAAGFAPDYALPGLPHRTGHGVGLSIHEAPYLVRGDETPLEPGMCLSNEPMLVIPGQYGIRLEDHFYMTDDGPVWFTQPSPSIDRPFG